MGGNFIASLIRTVVQAGLGSAAGWLIAHGVNVPDTTVQANVALLVAAGVVAYTALVRWLETRQSAAARFLGRLLMLGIESRPVYVKGHQAVMVIGTGETRPPRPGV